MPQKFASSIGKQWGPLWGLNSLSFPLIDFKTLELYVRAAARLNAGVSQTGLLRWPFLAIKNISSEPHAAQL